MNLTLQEMAELELIIPTIAQGLIGVVPDMEVLLRDDIVILGSQSFPSADVNHASLFRTTPERTDALIEEVISFFDTLGLPASIMVSPACTPTDLSQRLEARGFVRQDAQEAWMVLEELQKFNLPKIDKSVTVKHVVTKEDVAIFSDVMTRAYEMPTDWTSYLAQILEPTVTVPGFSHYLAFVKGMPAATLTIMRHKNSITIGSGGVLPEYRGTRTIYNMAAEVLAKAKKDGVETVIGQTSLGAKFERYLRIVGFRFAFRRTEFKLG